MNIPKKIFQFCHTSASLLPIFFDAIHRTRTSNSDYEYRLIDDQFMKEFIGEHYGSEVQQLYSDNRIPASRCDLARLMLVYEFGGFYVDLSMELRKSLNSLCSNELVLLQRDDFSNYIGKEHAAHFTNSIIGARAKSPFIKKCIDDVIENFRQRKFNHDVINASGPGVINKNLAYFRSNSANFSVHAISFRKAVGSLFEYRRNPKFSNTWLDQQKKGIFPTPLGKSNQSTSYIFHLGWPCTYGLELQDVFLNNLEQLGKIDCIYPTTGRPNNSRAHHQLMNNLSSEHTISNLVSECAGYKTAVISSESLVSRLEYDEQLKLLKSLELKLKKIELVIFIQEVPSLVQTLYKQCVISDFYKLCAPNYKKSVWDFYNEIIATDKKRILQYTSFISKLIDIFGKDSVKIVPLNTGISNNAVTRFLSLAGIDTPLNNKETFSRHAINLSPRNIEEVLLYNREHSEKINPDQKVSFVSNLVKSPISGPPITSDVVLTEHQKEVINSHFKEEYALLQTLINE